MHAWRDPQQEGNKKPVGCTIKTNIVQFLIKWMNDGEMYRKCRIIPTPADTEHAGRVLYNFLMYGDGRTKGKGCPALLMLDKYRTSNRWCAVMIGSNTHGILPAST